MEVTSIWRSYAGPFSARQIVQDGQPRIFPGLVVGTGFLAMTHGSRCYPAKLLTRTEKFYKMWVVRLEDDHEEVVPVGQVGLTDLLSTDWQQSERVQASTG